MGDDPAPAQVQQQQVNKIELPAWVDKGAQENYEFAKQVAGRPLEQYAGPQVAELSPFYKQAGDYIANNVGSTSPYYEDAADIFRRTSGVMDIMPYLNPYTAEVEQNAIRNANESITHNLNANADAARAASAFGGSKYAIQDAVTQAEGTKNIGDLSAMLRLQGFNVASANALADRAGIRDSGTGLLGVASGKQSAQAQDIASLLSYGGIQQGHEQANIDALMRQFAEKQNYPVEQLNLRLAALGMSPYGKTETGTLTKESTSERLPTDWASIILGAGKIAATAVASDRTLKTDIKKLTNGPIPMYAYRYKGDPKSYPKVVGPMAQDIEKVRPSAVKKVGGKKVIDLSNLMEVLK
jgi:hypothetical protein